MSKLTNAAKGKPCSIRIPMICNRNDETTVSAHLNGIRFGHGVANKVSDLLVADACSSCHDAVDGRIKTSYSKDELKLMHLEGVAETILRRVAEGIVND